MKIYLDVIFLINFSFDFILLFMVRKILKRNVKIIRVFLGALLGALSIFLLFIRLSTLLLFLFKIVISILMVLITFSYRDIKYTFKNLTYLYFGSVLLGGFLYFINNTFSYKSEGILFYHNGFSINIVVLVLFGPLILYTYSKELREARCKYNQLYQIDVTFKNKDKKTFTAFLDTGSDIKDHLRRPVIIMDEKIKLKGKYTKLKVNTIFDNSYIKCYEVDSICIDGKILKNVLLGISPMPLNMEGVDCIIGLNILEGIYD